MRDIRARQSSVRSVSASDSVSTSSRTASGSCERDAAHRSSHNSVPLGSPVVGRSIRQVSTISATNAPGFLQLRTASKAFAHRCSQQRLTSASGVRKSASFVDRVNSTGPEFGARGECLLRRAAPQHPASRRKSGTPRPRMRVSETSHRLHMGTSTCAASTISTSQHRVMATPAGMKQKNRPRRRRRRPSRFDRKIQGRTAAQQE